MICPLILFPYLIPSSMASMPLPLKGNLENMSKSISFQEDTAFFSDAAL